MKTRDLTVILYDRQGCEISRAEAFDTMKRAKEHARHMLSDAFAQSSETTHAAFQTMKAAIFKDGEPIGANTVCEWDKEHPQHAAHVERERKRAELVNDISMLEEDPDNENAADLKALRAELAALV